MANSHGDERRDIRKALKCVEELLEPCIPEPQLCQAADILTSSQYSDVIDERHIEWLCGYPPCGNKLTAVPKQRFHISTSTNQVLDLTQRKKFCSPQCYKASNYFSAQLFSLIPSLRTGSRSVQLLALPRKLTQHVHGSSDHQPVVEVKAETDLNVATSTVLAGAVINMNAEPEVGVLDRGSTVNGDSDNKLERLIDSHGAIGTIPSEHFLTNVSLATSGAHTESNDKFENLQYIPEKRYQKTVVESLLTTTRNDFHKLLARATNVYVTHKLMALQ